MAVTGVSIDVDTEMLHSFGADIYAKGEDYLEQVVKLYATIEALDSSWTGSDSTAYVNKVKAYKTDIENLGNAIKDYGTFLKESSKVLAGVRADIESQVK